MSFQFARPRTSSIISQALGIKTGNEELEPEVVINEEEVVVTPDPPLNEEVEGAADVMTESEAIQEEADKLNAALESFTNLAYAIGLCEMSEAECQTVMSEDTIQVLETAIDNVLEEHLDVRAEEVPILPATEDRKTMTYAIGLESIGERWGKIWESIKAALKAAIEKLVEAVSRVTDNVKKIRYRAAQLKAKAAKLDESGKVSPETISGSFVGKLVVGGKHSIADIDHGFENAKKVGNHLFTTYVDATATLYREAAAGGKSALLSLDEGKAAADHHEDKESVNKLFHAWIDRVDATKLGLQLPGNMHLGIGGDQNDAFAGSSLALHRFEGPSAEHGGSLPTLGKGQINNLLSQVDGLCETMKDRRASVRKLEAAAADFRKAFDGIVGQAEKSKIEQMKARAKLQAYMRFGSKPWVMPLVQFSIGMGHAMVAALQYAERSIAAHHKGAKAA